MAESAVNFLIEYMGPLLVDEVKLLKGVRGEARKIRDELETMRAFLRDADAREDSNEGIKTWVRQVRHVAYDTEDALDDFIVHIGQYHQDRRGVIGFLRKITQSIKQLKARHRIASKIQDIRSRLVEISNRKDSYNLSTTDQVSTLGNLNREVYDPRMAALFTKDSELVGIDEPRTHLINWLLRDEQRHSTMAVFGMGGLGKTTLVKKVFDSEQVKNHFETYAWITVSETFKKKEVLRDMITQLYTAKKEQAPSMVDAMTDTQLIQVSLDFLQNKRFVLVFDDLWELDAWKLLSFALPSNESGSRVILTMRRRDLASSCCIRPSDFKYELQPLNPNMTWSLFCQRAFPTNNDNQCPSELEMLARSLVKKCCGLPLAIVTLGGLLASKDQTYAVWDITHRSLGTEIESDNLRSMMKILWLNFNDLPYYLKSCFLYLSVFPEDYYIGSPFIISLWIAEGFIIRKEGLTLEELGESYLNALVNRSLVQVTKSERYGDKVTFRILDLLREIIISKSKEETLCVSSSFVEEDIIFLDRIRHLSIHKEGTFVPKLESSSHLHSFFIFGMNRPSTTASVVPSFSGLHLLRVICIANVPIESFPEQLTSLHHLRYLGLHNTNIKYIPSSIGKLKNLEALILYNIFVCELPVEICKLQRLRNLYVDRRVQVTGPTFHYKTGAKVPKGVGSLRSLQKLRHVEVESGAAGELGKLTEMRELRILNVRREDGHDLCAAIEKMSHLESLGVTSIDEDEEIDLDSLSHPPSKLLELLLIGRLVKLPEWILALQNLRILQLHWCRLRNDPLKSLSLLANLVQFRLSNAYDGEELCLYEGAYPKLRQLHLTALKGLKKISVEKGAMPNLEILVLAHCKTLPVEQLCWLQHMTKLTNLIIAEMPMEFLNSLTSGGERADFIKHIPNVSCHDLQTGSSQQL